MATRPASMMIKWIPSVKGNRSLAEGALWGVAGSVSASGLAIIALIVLARILDRFPYGQFIAVQTIVTTISLLIGFGFGIVATKSCAEYKSRDPAQLGRLLASGRRAVLGSGLLIILVFGLCGPWIARWYLQDADITLPLQIGALSIMLLSLDSYQKNILVGLEAMKAYAIGTALAAAVAMPLMVGLAMLYGLNGAVAGMAASALLQCLFSRWQMRRELARWAVPDIAPDNVSHARIWSLGGPTFISNLAAPAVIWVLQAILIHGQGAGYGEVALFGLAVQWFNIMMFLPASVARALLPSLADKIAGGDVQRSQQILLLGLVFNAAMAALFLVPFLLLSDQIVALYGPAFADQSLPLVYGVLAAGCAAASLPIQNLMVSQGSLWRLAAFNAAGFGVAVAVMMLVLPPSAQSAALAMLLGQAIVVILMLTQLVRFMGLVPAGQRA
jgi:O-antigen/teichoic acid export membrane protein